MKSNEVLLFIIPSECLLRCTHADMAAQWVSTVLMLALVCAEFGLSQSSNGFSGSFLEKDDSADEDVVQVDDTPKDTPEIKPKPAVYCNNDTMTMLLPSGPLKQVKILGYLDIESVLEAPESCKYSLTRGSSHNILQVDYNGCHVTLEDGQYTVTLIYPNKAGRLAIATLSCDANENLAALPKNINLQSDQIPKCGNLPGPGDIPSLPRQVPPPNQNILLLNTPPAGCGISTGRRLTCGTSQIRSEECLAKGCCYDVMTYVCYYPMDECTADKTFVFVVPNDFANIPVNPMSLMVAGKSGCKPVVANKDFAVFKFSVTECGTRSFVIGETIIYLAEVRTIVKVRNLKYGMISRDNPVSLLVECRYPKTSTSPVLSRPLLASAGYMVMSPSLPPYLHSEGLFGVQLLIATDDTFTAFYPKCHLPLSVLLGKSVFLELRLKSPKPQATLLVHYCVAYPRSAKSALVLIFEGCPNPLDAGNTSILYMKDLPQNRHQRRFEIKAFQFMDRSTNKYLNEEIYFMCSTEVCMPSGLPCVETCFDGSLHE